MLFTDSDKPRFMAVLISGIYLALGSIALHAEDPVLRLATIGNLPPYSFEKEGVLQGVDIDTVLEIAKRARVRVQIETMPWARVLLSMEHGFVDGAFSMYFVESRKAFLEYVGIMHYDNLGLIALREKPLTYEGITSLYGLRVARGRGVFVSEEFEAAAGEKRLTVIDSDDTQMGNVRMLLAGRVDAVIGVAETMGYYAAELGASNRIMIVNGLIDPNRPGYLTLAKKSPAAADAALRERLATAAQTVMADGTYRSILEKYRPSPGN